MIKINLQEEKKSFDSKVFEHLKNVNWKLMIFAIIFFKIPGISVGIYFKNEFANLSEEKERLKVLVEQHNKYVKEHRGAKEQVKLQRERIIELESKIEQIQKISKKKQNPFYLLESIIHIIPEDVWLTELMVKNGSQIKIKGMSREYKFINSFKSNLNRNPFFENSFVLDETKTKTEGKNKKANSSRDEVFALSGKIMRFEL